LSRNGIAIVNSSQNTGLSYLLLYFLNGLHRHINKKARPITVNMFFITLVDAVKIGRMDIVIHMLDNGANPNTQDSQALIQASKDGNADIVKLLLDCGADPAAQSARAISEAARRGHVAVWSLLTEYGAILTPWMMALALANTT
jgi:ankyrin repeat protein